MTLGEHILILRKQKKFSQSVLGKAIGTSGDIIGRYERDIMSPSIDVIIKLADTLGVSIDFLVGKTTIQIDHEALNRLEELSKLPNDQKNQVFNVIDALVRDFKAKQAYAS